MRSNFHISLLTQLSILAFIWLVGEAIARMCHLPFPGSIVGMFLLLGALKIGIVPEDSIERGARLLLGEMLLFFIPAVLVVLDHREFFGRVGLEIIVVVLVGTILVMVSTGLTIELLTALKQKRGAHL